MTTNPVRRTLTNLYKSPSIRAYSEYSDVYVDGTVNTDSAGDEHRFLISLGDDNHKDMVDGVTDGVIYAHYEYISIVDSTTKYQGHSFHGNILIPSNKLSIGDPTTIESALQISADKVSTVSTGNAGIHIGREGGFNAGIEFAVEDDSQTGHLDFSVIGSDYQGRIEYDHTDKSFKMSADGVLELEVGSGLIEAFNNDITTTGDITCTSLGVGTTTPEGAFQITGNILDTPTVKGVSAGLLTGVAARLKLCAATATDFAQVDFTYPSTNFDGRIAYDMTNSQFLFKTGGDNTRFTLNSTTADFQAIPVTTTGTVTGGSLTDGTATITSGSLTTTGNVSCGDITITGTAIGFPGNSNTIQDVYDNESAQPHLVVGTTSNEFQIKGHASVTNVMSVINESDVEKLTISRAGVLTAASLTDGTATLASGSLTSAIALTASGAITGGSITDGTATLASGSLTSAIALTASGAITGGSITDGTATLASGSLTSAIALTASGAITGGSITDGTATIASGSLTSAIALTASGAITGGSITDGTATLASGSLTSAVALTASGAITGGSITDGTATLTSGAISGLTTIAASGDLNINSGVFFVDASTGQVGVGIATPESGFQVVNAVLDTPTVKGVSMGLASTLTEARIKLCSADSTENSQIDFTVPGTIYDGRIAYNHNTQLMTFKTNGNNTRLTINATDADFQALDITTTGDITGGSLTDGTATLTSGAISGLTTIAASGDLNINSGVFFVDASTGLVGVGTATPESGFQVAAAITITEPTVQGISMGNDGDNAEVRICAASGSNISRLDFTQVGEGDDFAGRITYSHSSEKMIFKTGGTTRLELDATCADFKAHDIVSTGTIDGGTITDGTFSATSGALTGITTLAASGDVAINTDALFVDVSAGSDNGYIGINTTAPLSSLHVKGARLTTPTDYGIHMGYSDNTSGSYGIEIVSEATGTAVIDFTKPNSNRRGRIVYDLTDEEFEIRANDAKQMTIANNAIDMTDCAVTTTGVLTGGTITDGTFSATSGALTGITTLAASGDMAIDTDTLFVDVSVDAVGFGTTGPTAALTITGTYTDSSANDILGIHGYVATTMPTIRLTSATTASNRIFFNEITNGNNGGIEYYNSAHATNAHEMAFSVNSASQLVLSATTADFQDNDITTTGDISGNLNSTKGQLITFMGGQAATLVVSAYDFNYGNGDVSDASFGMLIPCAVKLKKFCYASSQTGTAYSTSTRIVFRLWLDGTGQSVYAFCDFSDTTNGDVTVKRFSGKFSSSISSQVDVEPSVSNAYGSSLAWETVTLTSYNTDNDIHRFSIICETTEDL